MSMELFGNRYVLDLSFSFGDVVMTILTILAFRITLQMAKIAKKTEAAEKMRTHGRTYYLIHSILLSMEDDEVISWDDMNRFNDEFPLMLQSYNTDFLAAIDCFRRTTKEYSEIKLKEIEEGAEPDKYAGEKKKCIKMAKYFRDHMPFMKQINDDEDVELPPPLQSKR